MASLETRVAPLVMGPVGASKTWTGPPGDRFAGEHMFRRIRAEVWAPAAGTLYLDHWDKEDKSDRAAVKSWSIGAGAATPTEWVDLTKRYYGWRFVNGSTAQNDIRAFEEKMGRPVADVSISQSSVTVPTSATLANVEGTPGSAAPSKAVQIAGTDGTNLRAVSAGLFNGDARSASADYKVAVGAFGLKYNGASWDMERNNTEGTLLASAARTASSQSADQTNHNARGVIITLDITAAPGGGETLTLAAAGKDVLGKGKALTAFGALTGTGRYHYIIYPGAVATTAIGSTAVQGFPLPRTWYALCTHSGSGSWTYSVTFAYIV